MTSHNCCNNYTRSKLLRGAAAQAGQGLPAIESGMPLPAGTGLTRRRMLAGAAGLALSVYGASKLPIPILDAGIAEAAQSNRVIVSIFLDGGADALSILAPTGHPRYFDLRPNLAINPAQASPFSEDTSLSWNPAADGLRTLHSEGKVTVLPAIGYDDPNQSHFTSRHFWEVGALDTGGSTGWMGRYLDLTGSDVNPLQGLSLSGTLSPAMATLDKPVAAVEGVTGYDLWAWVDDPVTEELYRSFKRFGEFSADSDALNQARRAIGSTNRVRETLEDFNEFTSPVAYPDSDLARQLSGLGALLGAGLPLHCVSVSADGGYDTHSDQKQDLARNLKTTCDSILAFQRDLESRGLQDRVLVEMWSEFGRRPEENGSAGTDHGAAGTAFIIGSMAEGKMIGEFPGLTTLDQQDNLRHTSDFRAMYCSLLEQWLEQDAGPIIPGAAKLARPKLVRA
jgi:uncharacterized protein (DUF1501 family)